MIKWTRPEGTDIETNDLPDTIAAAERLGWVRADAPVKRKRRTKAEMQAAKEDMSDGNGGTGLQGNTSEDSSPGL